MKKLNIVFFVTVFLLLSACQNQDSAIPDQSRKNHDLSVLTQEEKELADEIVFCLKEAKNEIGTKGKGLPEPFSFGALVSGCLVFKNAEYIQELYRVFQIHSEDLKPEYFYEIVKKKRK